ncbi:DNA cytosine methyltransferase [Peptococcaceae bacterium]|nr:DNA cytosine methyltransferase [Peptococcaceae bacterium]
MSSGFMQTGKFEIVAAVEKDVCAQKTYEKNHKGVIIKDDINDIDFDRLTNELGDIDVIIGGPPCQGFSNANRQKNRIISTNNQLVKKYVEAIMSINPKAFVMENVSMIRSKTHKFFITHSERDIIKQYGIELKEEEIKIGQNKELADYLNSEGLMVEQFKDLLFNTNEFNIINILYKKSRAASRMLIARLTTG